LQGVNQQNIPRAMVRKGLRRKPVALKMSLCELTAFLASIATNRKRVLLCIPPASPANRSTIPWIRISSPVDSMDVKLTERLTSKSLNARPKRF
jgi:hypothetical protein